MKSTTIAVIVSLVAFILCSAPAAAMKSEHPKLTNIAAAIQDVLNGLDADVRQAAEAVGKTTFNSKQTQEALSALCRKHQHAVDCAIIGTDETIVAVEPGTYHKTLGKNVGDQDQVKRLRRTAKPVLSKIFKAIEGSYVFALQWPIAGPKGKLTGSVSMIEKPEPFLKEIIMPELEARDMFNVWVMQDDGQVLFSRHKEAIGAYASEDNSYIGNRSLVAVLRKAQHEKEGSTVYRQKGIGRAESEDMALYWTTVGLHGTEWRVVVFGKPTY